MVVILPLTEKGAGAEVGEEARKILWSSFHASGIRIVTVHSTMYRYPRRNLIQSSKEGLARTSRKVGTSFELVSQYLLLSTQYSCVPFGQHPIFSLDTILETTATCVATAPHFQHF